MSNIISLLQRSDAGISMPLRAAMILFALVCLLPLSSCRSDVKSADSGRGKIRIVATLFPLYDMAKYIGADKADVQLLLPPGAEAHSFEPRPGDIVKINEADVFIYTGGLMEPWAEKILKGAVNKKLVVVNAGSGTRMLHAAASGKNRPDGASDPHIWLDFDNAAIMVDNILRGLLAQDSAGRGYYIQKADAYKKRLAGLDSDYKSALAACRHKEIIYAGHYAFGYPAARYGLKYLAAVGISPDAEPTAADLVRLVEQIRKDNIRYLFYEELSSPKIAETVAGETGAKMLLLSAAHNVTKEQLDAGVSYFDIVSKNLENLKVGLECR